jgi:anaerobic magnesium-protoporphyrin IX monomethyl ester cyclase
MKIVLIDPPTSHEQIYGDWDLSGVDTYSPPLGLLYIASFIREHGHTPYVIDVTARKWSFQQAVDNALALNPDGIGISAKTINIYNADKIARELKKKGFTGFIVLGGAHISAVPLETFSRFQSFDFGVIGEGESTFLELIENISKKRSIKDVLGIIYRDDTGQIITNPPRPVIANIDILPLPAWDLLPDFPNSYPHNALETRRLPAASIITSRGCPFSCTFCDRAIFGSVVRQHSADYTLNMIRHLKERYGIRDLMMLDDNFILDKKKLFKVCDAMIEEKMDLTWYCMGHAKVMTEDRLRKIKESGCWFIEIGIESGSDRILNFIRKNTNKTEIAQAVKRARDAGLKVKGNFIFGFPTETKESLKETIDFAKSIGLAYFQQNFLTVWPGCEIAVDPQQYGQVETDWTRLAHQRVTFIPNGLTEPELVQASKEAFRSFYLRPQIILEVGMQSLTSWHAMLNAGQALLAFMKTMFRKTRESS